MMAAVTTEAAESTSFRNNTLRTKYKQQSGLWLATSYR